VYIKAGLEVVMAVKYTGYESEIGVQEPSTQHLDFIAQ
jgi:hypothetical protein